MRMDPAELRSRLEGAIAFPVTPFHADWSLDLAGLRRNIRVLLADPPVAIVAAGGTGELFSLTPAEHLAVVRAAAEECESRIPVIAGVGFNAMLAADLARAASQAGADGILAFPPYYPQPDDEGLTRYYEAIGRATPLGLLVYSRDWFHPGAELVERLADMPSLIAWKDGQGDMRRLQILQSRLGDRLQWIGGAGDDLVPAYYLTGIRAFTSSVANVAPGVARALHEHASRGDAAALDPLMRDLIVPLYALRGRRRGYEVSVMKALMNLLGLSGGVVRPPLVEVRPEELDTLRAMAPAWRTAARGAPPQLEATSWPVRPSRRHSNG